MYVEDYGESHKKEGIGIHVLHAIATSKNTEYDKRLVTAQEFIYEQRKYFYCLQASSTVDLLARSLLMTGMDMWFTMHQ